MTTKLDLLEENVRLELIGELSEGTHSLRELEKKYNISRTALSKFAISSGIQRGQAKAKRGMHDALLIYEKNEECKHSTGNPSIDTAARFTADVGRRASKVAVNIINRLLTITSLKEVEQLLDEKGCSIAADALRKAWDSFASINKLNDSPPEEKQVVIQWDKAP